MRERLHSAINIICLFREIGGGGLVDGWVEGGLNFLKFWRNTVANISVGEVRWPDLYYAVERGVEIDIAPHSRWQAGGSGGGYFSH